MPGLKADKTRRQDPVEYLNMQFPHNKTRYCAAFIQTAVDVKHKIAVFSTTQKI